MTKLEQALTAFPTLAPEQQDTIADFIIDAALPVINFSDEELDQIDARTAAADAGDFASEKQVEEVFTRFR
jgi:predicted transcriptional regulator